MFPSWSPRFLLSALIWHCSLWNKSVLHLHRLETEVYLPVNLYSVLNSWRRWWHPTPVLLPGKSHGWRSLVGCSPWGCKESDTTERLPFRFSLSCIEEGNGNPLQCFCLESPRDGGAWRAAVYGVTQNRTRLKRLSSSSSSIFIRRTRCYLKKYN